MVKSIIKRILVGVGIALALMFIKGNLLIVANAKTESYASYGYYYQCQNCSSLQYSFPSNTFANMGPGTLTFQVSVWNFNTNVQSTQFSTVLTNIAVTANDGKSYACTFNGIANPKDISEEQGYLYNHPFTSSYSVQCYVDPGTTGIQKIDGQIFGYLGTDSIRYWGPFTFVESENAAMTQAIQEQTQATEDINNSINDESDADTGGFLEDIDQDYSNNPVSDLITMPITFLQRLNNNVSGSCITWNLGSLLGTNLTMPCINLQQILGSTLYNLIDMAICLFLAYNLGLMCVTIWNNMTSLKDDFDDMYSPRHAYNGKHSGGDS